MNKKFILHYGHIAGIPYTFSLSLRKLGLNSISAMPFYDDKPWLHRELPSDKVLYNINDKEIIKKIKRYYFFGKVLHSCSLIHYYSCGMINRYLDYKIFNYLKRPIIISFGGTDVRIENIARKNNPYFYQMPYSRGEKEIRKRLEIFSHYIKYAATDYELSEYIQPYFDKVFILPQSIDLSTCYYKIPNTSTTIPIIIHIPTHREFKGTKYIEAAIERLKTEGLSFDFRLLNNNITQQQVKYEIAKADIVVDQIRAGCHGVTAVEGMASGKPTVCYIRDDLIDKYPSDLPLVNANPDTIYDKLKELIQDSEMRREIGMKSRKYVEKYHSLDVIGPRLLEIYKEIGLKT